MPAHAINRPINNWNKNKRTKSQQSKKRAGALQVSDRSCSHVCAHQDLAEGKGGGAC